MKALKFFVLSGLCALGLLTAVEAQAYIAGTMGDLAYDMSGTYRPETFYGKNLQLLNNNNVNDKIWWLRHTIDLKTHWLYGQESLKHVAAEFQLGARNRAAAGKLESLPTTDTDLKLVDAAGGSHKHFIARNLFWVRELWLSLTMADMLGLTFDPSHKFKIGLFPFQLGRGIALGDAYATGPEYLGFYTESIVDQFAFGALFEGDFIPKKLHYDVYAAILQNKCGSFGEANQKIRGQEFGRLDTPARGFGKVNFLVATRLKWEAFNNFLGRLTFEPYGLFNHDPEQRIEFVADASSKLGTFGLASEYAGDYWEGGFDWAFNIGKQSVRGWDRNQIVAENRNGVITMVNSHVVDQNGKKIPFVRGSATQNVIENNHKTQQDESLNSKVIGQINGVDITNDKARYRNPYSNKYEGYMFVIDAACWVYKKELQFAVTAGISSGDDNPNVETKDQQYSGFIPLQEIYSGKRVPSAFLLSSGKINRPLSVPDSDQTSKFAKTVSNFSNLVFWGSGLKWEPTNWKRKLSFRPNVLMFWEDFKINKFDALTNQELAEKASSYLGTELNLYIDYFLLKDMKAFLVTSLFVPGTHFVDIKGRPFNKDQEAELLNLDTTGTAIDRIPNIGNDIAYTFNLGLEFKF